MRTFIFALAAIVLASCVIGQAGAADRLPAFDIARNCNEETGGSGIGGPAACTKDETDAKNELEKRWSQFGASEKGFCVGESSAGGEQSYVELLTCLEMSTGQLSNTDQWATTDLTHQRPFLSHAGGVALKGGGLPRLRTNRPEILDPALLRAGRFDRQVLVDRPDKRDRVAILKVHLKKTVLASDVDPEQIAELTPGFTGADLANLVNEAALLATRRGAESVHLTDFTAAVERIVAGLEKKTVCLFRRNVRSSPTTNLATPLLLWRCQGKLPYTRSR